MNRILMLIASVIFCCIKINAQEHPWKGTSVDFSHGNLAISENKRFLIFEDGTPFFYLGDTGRQQKRECSSDFCQHGATKSTSNGEPVL